LKARAPGMSWQQKRLYGRAVRLAWWLHPTDAGLLATWVIATDHYRTASAALDTRVKDPRFADPTSTISKEGLLYNRLTHRYASLMIKAGHALGFSPAGRRAIGVG
jgi:hypothetical protein